MSFFGTSGMMVLLLILPHYDRRKRDGGALNSVWSDNDKATMQPFLRKPA
jgi:hypothetical protein